MAPYWHDEFRLFYCALWASFGCDLSNWPTRVARECRGQHPTFFWYRHRVLTRTAVLELGDCHGPGGSLGRDRTRPSFCTLPASLDFLTSRPEVVPRLGETVRW